MSIFERKKNIQVNITSRTIFNAAVIITAFFLLLKFISIIAWPLQLIAISAFLAMALNPAVSWIARKLKSKSRVLATAAAYLTVLIILAGFLLVVVPPMIDQAGEISTNIPTSVNDLQNQDTPLVNFINRYGLQDEFSEFVSDVKNNLQDISGKAVSTVSAIGGALIAVITVLVMTFMMLVEGPGWVERIWSMLDDEDTARRRRVAQRMYGMVTGYVNGQLVVATIAAFFAFIALVIASTIFGVTINAPALALVVGLLGLIPMIGNMVAAVVVVIVSLFVSLPLALTMGVFFLVYQQIENATLQPYIQSKYNDLTPLTVFIAALIGISVGGFLGALVAIPIAGCVRILILEYYGDKLKPAETKKD